MSLDQVNPSSELAVRRSQRDGLDRAYVKVGNRTLGYRDLASGEVRCKQLKYTQTVAAATAEMWDEVQSEPREVYRPRHAAPEDLEPVPV